jgi:hypothetical protein
LYFFSCFSLSSSTYSNTSTLSSSPRYSVFNYFIQSTGETFKLVFYLAFEPSFSEFRFDFSEFLYLYQISLSCSTLSSLFHSAIYLRFHGINSDGYSYPL